MLNAALRHHRLLMTLTVLALVFQILLPAWNKSLWYDELDGRMLGTLGFKPYDESTPLPLDRNHIDGSGHLRAFPPGWNAINWLGNHLSHDAWRAWMVAGWAAALVLWSLHRLSGLWRLAPLLLAIASPLVLRGASTTRAYDLGALGIVLALIALDLAPSRRRTALFITGLVMTWQLHLVALASLGCLSMITLGPRVRLTPARKQDTPLWISLITVALLQALWMASGDMPRPTIDGTLVSRLLLALRAFNTEGLGLVWLVPALLCVKRTPRPFWILVISLILLPALQPWHRTVYLVMTLPLMLVETVVALKTWSPRWAPPLLAVAACTQLGAWPAEWLLPRPHERQFTDPVCEVRNLMRPTPLVALFESRHRKWTRDDAVVHAIRSRARPGDRLLYEFSRLSVLSRLWHVDGMTVTGIFRHDSRSFPDHPDHPRAQALAPDSPLIVPTPPFWAVSPLDSVITERNEALDIEDMTRWLSQWGRVTVIPVEERPGTWRPNTPWPPEPTGRPSPWVVYYVE